MNHEDLVTNVGPYPSPTVTSGVSWGAIFAGALVSASMWLLLHILGTSIGLTAIDPETSSLRAIGIGTGVWSLIAPLLALFLGGLAAGRLAGPMSWLTGAIHGAVVWSLATLATLSLLWMTLTAVLGGAVAAGAEMAPAMSGAAMQAMEECTPETLGVVSDELLAPVNHRLRAEGKPAVTDRQLRDALRDGLKMAVKQGRMDRLIVVSVLTRDTPMTQAEASDVATSLQRRFDESVARVSDVAKKRTLEAAEAMGKALLGLSLAMVLGLVAAVGGAVLSGRHEMTRARRVGPGRGLT